MKMNDLLNKTLNRHDEKLYNAERYTFMFAYIQ